jgi:C-terminal processing protease CtpA/Prc
MVCYLASYFFDERPVILNRFFDRPSNRTTDQTTLASVPGRRMPGVPLYILTSRRTFSAAEGFAYSLQALKRATVVGETTGGGAHPSVDMPIGSGLVAFVPVARSMNPVTGTDWEGTGVAPDLAVDADHALETAIRDAQRRIGD